MNKKQSRRRRDIKSKLMAAICMLLVSSIMMVSTTYAWFTLSTAPEVTGITTAVGANGNLEMALLPLSGDTDDITSNVGDSYQTANKTKVTANVTWGNLVDLSDASYGLSEIALYPSALNFTSSTDENGKVTEKLGAAYLNTPLYGVDGRVTELKDNTVTSTYVSGEGFPNNSNFGVRAVGTAAGMTDRQLTYRNAQSDATSAMVQAKNSAAVSLNTNGAALANIAMAHAANEKAMHSDEDVAALMAIVTDLETGALQHIETAYAKYILAYAASAASGLSDEQFTAFKAIVTGKSLSEVQTELAKYSVSLPETVGTNIGALNATKAKVNSAKTELGKLSGETEVTWGQITTAMGYLVNTGELDINGFGVSDVKSNLGAIVTSIGKLGGLIVTMPTGGGIYADIADHCGDFQATITLKNISAGGVTMEEMDARMKADSSVEPSYLSVVGNAVAGAGAPSSAAGNTMPLTDYYGYVIDLAFRTNAASSDLLLQTAGIDRIYKDSNGAVQDDGSTTMGNGSTMTFAAVDTSFNNEQVTALMQAIRVVFFEKGSGNILAKGRLDAASAKPGADGITMNLVLYKEVVTYVEATEGATHISDGKGGYRPVEGTEPATHKVSGTAMTNLDQQNAVITALNQNDAHTVSVLVYLDGNLVTNKEVSATGSKSVTGKMNLQFSSSAQLTPMVYTPLTQQTGKVALPGTMLKTINVSGEATAVGAFEEDAVTIALTAAEGKEITAVTAVSVGNTALESTAYTYANGKLTFTSTGITEDTVVAITVTTTEKA